MRLLRQVSFLAASKPGLFRAVLETVATVALAEGMGETEEAFNQLDTLFKREVSLGLSELGLNFNPKPLVEGSTPDPQ